MTIIKICGITRLVDARAALQSGADLLGFNFYAASPRSISPDDCTAITSEIAQEFPRAILVGVFVNMPFDHINEIMQRCGLQLAQLHGDEMPQTLKNLQEHGFKAFRNIPKPAVCREYASFMQDRAPVFLVDAAVNGLYGGSGVTADWQAAAQLARQYPILLAGGLTPANVAEAIHKVHPWGVDTASGVETSPREKDSQKIQAFVQAVRKYTDNATLADRPDASQN